jgi:formylglycine-generating enzyme
MGSDEHYAEEALSREVTLDGFWIDRHDVTNAQFARFVEATGYVTLAERTPDAKRASELPPPMRVAGSAVFVMPEGGRAGQWRYIGGANYCARYRPAARQAHETDSGTSHIGFRTARNGDPS